MLQVHSKCEYADTIRQFFQATFPAKVERKSDDLIELITDAIVASGKVRLGPNPNIESLYLIRQYLSTQTSANQPINFLMPWGSEKPGAAQIVDMAEVVALKTLLCLRERIQNFYSPGIQIRVRVEDATAPNLFYQDRDSARDNAKLYSDSLEKLVRVFGVDDFVQIVRETTMVTEDRFEKAWKPNYEAMVDYIYESEQHSDPETLRSYNHLTSLGWAGTIPIEQREHYRSAYQKLYGYNYFEANNMLARYLAQSLTRKQLKMLGNLDWTDYLGLSFVGSIPGEPKNLAAKRIYYRTIPENISTNHLAPWRAKGYLSIDENGARPRLTSWSDIRRYHKNVLTLHNGTESMEVNCDYEIVS